VSQQAFEHLVLGAALGAGGLIVLGGIAHEWRLANREWRERWRR
jgi:hypothetical protein